MPGIDGTLIDETYDLGVLAGDDPYELAWPYVTAFTLAVGPPVFVLVTAPLIIFLGASAPAALVATQELLSWEGVAQMTVLTSLTRAMDVQGLSQTSARISAIDLLTWEGSSQLTSLSSQPRGGG